MEGEGWSSDGKRGRCDGMRKVVWRVVGCGCFMALYKRETDQGLKNIGLEEMVDSDTQE